MNTKVELTEIQSKVLTYCYLIIERDHNFPTTRFIQEYFGWKSQTAVMGHLRALERKGAISKSEQRYGSYRINEPFLKKLKYEREQSKANLLQREEREGAG